MYGQEGKKYPPYTTLDDTKEKMEFKVVVGDRVEPWSVCYNIPAGVIRDGISCNFLLVDETQYISSDKGSLLTNFGSSSNPVKALTGIETSDSNSMQFEYKQYDKDMVSRYTIPFPLAYKTIKLSHPSRAEDALKFFINKVKMQGINSTEVMTHFMMRGDCIDGKFVTQDFLRRNNLLQSEIHEGLDNNVLYRVGGVDLASAQDYSAMVVTDVYRNFDGQGYRYEVRNIYTFNPDKQQLNQKSVSKEIARICLTMKIDLLIVDASSTQQFHANTIVDEVAKIGINTLVAGYQFANRGKVTLMSYLESTFYSQTCKLPKEDWLKRHKSWKLLYGELLTLRKEKKDKTETLQFYAKLPDTDDHCMALAMSVYGVKYIELMIAKGDLIKLENKRYVPRLNKFKLLSEIENKKERQYLYANVF